MKTQKECEQMATKKLQEYVNSCQCEDPQDAINALAKMVAVTLQAIDLVKYGNRATVQ